MESELFDGGQGETTLRTSLRMVQRAIDNDWPLTPEKRKLVVDKAVDIISNSADERKQILAMKILVSADSVNVRRETNKVSERHHEVLEATLVLRAAMQGDNIREQLAKLSDEVCAPIPLEVQQEIDDIHIDATNEVRVVKTIKDFPNGHNGKS